MGILKGNCTSDTEFAGLLFGCLEQGAIPVLTVHLVTVADFSYGKDTDWAPKPIWTTWRIS
jgi:hypothetical protein